MLINSIEELRLIYPNHAFDSIDGMVGFIDNSEHSFLEDKLGTPLYEALCQYYADNPSGRSTVADYQTTPWNRLLLMAQRVVGFDALGRAAGMQAVSVNNSGINMSVAGDYPVATKDNIETYRKTCYSEAMKSLDNMLAELEKWVTEAAATVPAGSASGSPADETSDISPQPSDIASDAEANSSLFSLHSSLESERSEIVTLWKKSRYYYLAAQMLLPSAVVLQQYVDFSESREKFIRMLPDLRFIQEEVIANAVGEEWLAHLTDVSLNEMGDDKPVTTKSPLEHRIIHQLRKVMVAWLVSRTQVIKYTNEERTAAHDDGVRKIQDVCDFVRKNQDALLDLYKDDQDTLDAYKASPLYVEPSAPPAPDGQQPTANGKPPKCGCSSGAALWTPPLF